MKITKESLQKEVSLGNKPKDIATKYNISVWSIYKKIKQWNCILPEKEKPKMYICSECGKQYKQLKSGLCNNCLQKENHIKKGEYQEATTDLGKKILKLRSQHKSMRTIANELNCSISTVSYYCNNSTKIKSINKAIKVRNGKYRWLYLFGQKVYDFQSRKFNSNQILQNLDWNKKLRTAVSFFRNRNNQMASQYNYKDVLKAWGGTKLKCYLTGRDIDIEKDQYALDHIIPVSRGGSNEIDNMGLTCIQANSSKSDMTVDEYLSLCKEVLEYNGYTVTKK